MGYMYKYRYTSNHKNGKDWETIQSKDSQVGGRLSARALVSTSPGALVAKLIMRAADPATMQVQTPARESAAALQPSTTPTTVYRRTRRSISEAPP
jgi:hypothetical protein